MFLATVIHHAKSNRPAVICGLSGSTNQTINGTALGKTLLNIKSVFRFSLRVATKTFRIPGIIRADTVINVHTSSCDVPDMLARF
jgi:hypothetical protein